MAKKKKIKRRRQFSTLTAEGQELAFLSFQLKEKIPNKQERLIYINTLHKELDDRIKKLEKEEKKQTIPEKIKISCMGVGNGANKN